MISPSTKATLTVVLCLLSTPFHVTADNRSSGDPLFALGALHDPAVFSVSALTLDTTTPLPTPPESTGFRESPFDRSRVLSGDVPELTMRLPAEPPVINTGGGIYGGTISLHWQGSHASPYVYNADLDILIRSNIDSGLLTFRSNSDDQGTNSNSYTANILPGAKWSDGTAFTADDIQDFYENVLQIAMPEPWNDVSFEKISDHEFSLTFGTDDVHDVNYLHDIPWYFPKNYRMSKIQSADDFPTYYQNNSARQDDWEALYYEWLSRLDEPPPTLAPWVVASVAADHVVALRNPYYWAVDDAGNQLPYADRLLLYDDSATLAGEVPNVGDKLIATDNNVEAWERFPAFLTFNKGDVVDTLSSDTLYTVEDVKIVRSFASSEFYLLMRSKFGTCAARDCWVPYATDNSELDVGLLPPAAVVSGVAN